MAILRSTTNAKILGANLSKFPIVLCAPTFNVDWMSLYYFLDIYRSGSNVNTIRTYASHIVDFTSQLEVDEIEITEVNDSWFRVYKNSIKSRKNASGRLNSERYATQIIKTVITYLYWLEANKYVRGLIGSENSSRVKIQESDHGISYGLCKYRVENNRRRVTPRMSWIDLIKTHGPKRADLSHRFELMINWCKGLGLRAMEVCELTVDALPARESAEKAILNGKNVYIQLNKTKGSVSKRVPVSPVLVKNTWDYIVTDRESIVEKFRLRLKRRHETYNASSVVFLSDKTGQKLSSRSFSNAVRTAYLKAVESSELTEDEQVWAHGLRHNFIANLLKALDERKVNRPEAVARQLSRHSSVDAMEPYLTDRFNDNFDG